MNTPSKKTPLLTRNEALIALAVAVFGSVVTFFQLVECVACGKDYRSLEQELQAARARNAPPRVQALCDQALKDWTCSYCRGKGRASLMDRLVHGNPPPREIEKAGTK